MRHLSIVFIFLSFLGYGQSSLRFQETVHRFGELIENEEVSHTFTFLNEGIDSVEDHLSKGFLRLRGDDL